MSPLKIGDFDVHRVIETEGPFAPVSMLLPGVDMARVQYLEGQAEKYLGMAEEEERDKSPIYFAPNISVYTR